MGHRSHRNRLVGTTVAVAIFLLMSAFIGNFLLAKNASAGGLDVEWKVPLPTGFAQMSMAPDGSIVVREAGGSLRDIDRNGMVKWEYNASGCLEMSMGARRWHLHAGQGLGRQL